MVYTFDFTRAEAISRDNLPRPELISDLKNGLFVYKDSQFYTKLLADKLFDQLVKTVVYDKKSTVTIFGKTMAIPRKQTAFGDPGTTYSFSGTTVKAKAWNPTILKIKSDVERQCERKFNFCLVNYYADGDNYIGYHKDDEQDLGPAPSIASVSFGQT